MDSVENTKDVPSLLGKANELNVSEAFSLHTKDILQSNENELESKLLQTTPPVTNNDTTDDDKYIDFASPHDSDGESWETVSEEMRAEANAHQAEGHCLCNTCEMKSLNISNRVMKRSMCTKEQLPENVSKVVLADGTFIYIIGTAHFSQASQDDVAKTIQLLSPDVVMIELCSSRIGVLQLDEETLLQAAQDISITKLKMAIKESGSVMSGVMQLLLLSMSAHITKQLGMAPGGEFRVATSEAKKINGCRLVLGDRPIQATLGRAMASISIIQKIKLGWHLLFSKEDITKDDVEKYKQKDMIAEMIAEMTGDFPELSRVFVDERDLYMAKMLEKCGRMVRMDLPSSIYLQSSEYQTKEEENEDYDINKDKESDVESDSNSNENLVMGVELDRENYHPVVVGVVGIGHMNGIIANMGKSCDMDTLLFVPPASLASRSFRIIFKAAVVAVFSWGVYSVYKWVKK